MFFHDDAGNAAGSTSASTDRSTDEHTERYEAEQRGEDLRLAYVGLTRARHQAIVWWVPTADCRDSPLARLLFARDEHGNVAAEPRAAPRSDAAVDTAAAELADDARRTRSRSSRPSATAGPPSPGRRR